jgi:hypothetical protein
MPATRGFLVALLLLSVSCAGSSTPETGTRKPVVDRNVISNEELQDPVLQGMDALRAIQYLRPAFFRASGPQSFVNMNAGLAQFSMDYGPLQPLSNLAALPSLSLQMVYEIRYLDTNDAQNRFGLNANSGPVIVVVSNKQ